MHQTGAKSFIGLNSQSGRIVTAPTTHQHQCPALLQSAQILGNSAACLVAVVQSARWNWSTMVSRAGSIYLIYIFSCQWLNSIFLYQIDAKMNEMMERLATPHTTPISTSSSQLVSRAHCSRAQSRHPAARCNQHQTVGHKYR